MLERLISVEEREEWQQALAGIPHSYWHRWETSHALALGSGLPTYLYSIDGEHGRAVCNFSERSWSGTTDIFTPGGFGGFTAIGNATWLREKWLGFVRLRGYVCGYFALHPELGCAEAHDALVQSNDLYVLDLGESADVVRAQADRSVKRALRDWFPGRYVSDRAELSRFLIDHYSGFMAQKSASARSLWSEATLHAMAADPGLLMIGATDGQGLCAVHTFGMTSYGAECHLNVSIREGRLLTTPLIWWGIEQLAKRGVPWLQMGGGLEPDDSIARAKQKFRPRRMPFVAAKEIYEPEIYRTLCEQAGAEVCIETGYFPAYRSLAGVS
jgi:hypothetical protein